MAYLPRDDAAGPPIGCGVSRPPRYVQQPLQAAPPVLHVDRHGRAAATGPGSAESCGRPYVGRQSSLSGRDVGVRVGGSNAYLAWGRYRNQLGREAGVFVHCIREHARCPQLAGRTSRATWIDLCRQRPDVPAREAGRWENAISTQRSKSAGSDGAVVISNGRRGDGDRSHGQPLLRRRTRPEPRDSSPSWWLRPGACLRKPR